jgi:hypothetical protein
VVGTERSYIEPNNRERERLRALVGQLTEDDLSRRVNESWTVADMLGHIAFWDSRALVLADKFERGQPFLPSDHEPEDVNSLNATAMPLIRAIPPLELALLALRLAEETDRRVASLPEDKLWPKNPDSPLNPLRAGHRGEHLDQIEAALRST